MGVFVTVLYISEANFMDFAVLKNILWNICNKYM